MFVHRFFLNACTLTFALLSLFAARGQSQDSNKNQKSQDEVITLKAHLVNIDVTVKDKKGKYITDLKAEDFTIIENGTTQKIEFFDPPLIVSNQTGQSVAPGQPKAPASDIRPMNIISLVLDGQTTGLANMKQVREGMLKYIRERISDTDTVAVFGVSNDLQLLQTFTQDKTKLISAVENAYLSTASNKNLERNQVSENIEQLREELKGSGDVMLPQSPSAAALAPAAARALMASRILQQFVRLRSQLSVQQARPVLAALAAVCEAQRGIPGKKTLVLFSQGFITSSTLDWRAQGVIDIANRANVAIYIIDSTGLAAGAPRSGSFVPASPLEGVSSLNSTEDRMRTSGGENVFDNVRHEGLNREQDILYRIAGDTGGEFIKGTNDIAKGLDRIDQQLRARYTLAYYSTDSNFDGNFRKLKIEARRPDAKVVSREGYYAISGEDIAILSPEDRKLLAGFAAAEASPALPLFVELSPFRSQGNRYTVPLSIEVPPGAVKFARKGDRQQMHLDVLGVIRDQADKIISRLGGNFDVMLADEQYKSILNNNIFYRQDMELVPGDYSIELILRDRLSGKTAARRERLALPAADSEFSISGVVLSRYVTPVTSQSGDVLSPGGAQIRPSPSREFRVTDRLIIFFELYNAAISQETGRPLVRVTVTLMKEGKAATRPMDYTLMEAAGEPVPRITFAKYINLTGLAPGRYSAMIEVRDTVNRRTVTSQTPFVIAQ